VVTIDALATVDIRYSGGVGRRIGEWCKQNIASLPSDQMRHRFYDDFRNGRVHESRVKNGSEFDLRGKHSAIFDNSRLVVNPRLLFHDISAGLTKFVAVLKGDTKANLAFAKCLRSEFHYELTH
jgi:hypothetical protein